MFYYYAEFIKQLKPKMFFAENVKGLTTHDGGKTIETMINVFEDLGYKVEWKVLNAWDYGVAEKRQRVVIIGITFLGLIVVYVRKIKNYKNIRVIL